MKKKQITLLVLGGAILLSTSFKGFSGAKKEKALRDDVMQTVYKMAADSPSSEEDPKEIFSKAFEGYSKQFDRYLNIAGLNAKDKSEISVPGFDPSYVPPTFADVMHDYQIKLVSSLDVTQSLKFDALRQKSSAFDKYATLNETRYSNLAVKPKYSHAIPLPGDGVITQPPKYPGVPDIGIENGGLKPMTSPFSASSASIASGGLVAILAASGLTQQAIAGFTGSVTALSTALTTSWIPFVGWALAVAIAIGALIALVVIIVLYWEQISKAIDDVKAWFLKEFSKFSSLIESFFSDAVAKGKKSEVVEEEWIGGRKLEWVPTVIQTAEDAEFVEELKNHLDFALLIKKVKKQLNPINNKFYTSFYSVNGFVPVQWVKDFNLYDFGKSTYVWDQITAEDMMRNGTLLLKNQKPNEDQYKLVYHSFFINEPNNLTGFDHYHVYEFMKDSKTYDKVKHNRIKEAHSFFGPLYTRNTDSGKTAPGSGYEPIIDGL